MTIVTVNRDRSLSFLFTDAFLREIILCIMFTRENFRRIPGRHDDNYFNNEFRDSNKNRFSPRRFTESRPLITANDEQREGEREARTNKCRVGRSFLVVPEKRKKF